MKHLLLLIAFFITTASFAQEPEPAYTIVEKMPNFPGGMEMMMGYIHDNIQYPKGKKFEGANVCYITMVVEKDGSLTGIKVLRSAQGGAKFDKEAMRVIASMPNWEPGTQNGNLVRVQMNIPVKFTKQK